MGETDTTTLFLVVLPFVCFIAVMAYYYWLGDKLFKRLAERHPKYYKEEGRPMYFADPLSNLWASTYLMLLVIRGVPKDFPDDVDAKRLVVRLRWIGFALIFCIIMGAVIIETVLFR